MQLLLDVFGHLRVDQRQPNELWIVELDELIHGIQNGTNLFCCSADELVPLVKGAYRRSNTGHLCARCRIPRGVFSPKREMLADRWPIWRRQNNAYSAIA